MTQAPPQSPSVPPAEQPREAPDPLLRLQLRQPDAPRVVLAADGFSFTRLDSARHQALSTLNRTLREASAVEDPAQLLAQFAAWFQRNRPADKFIAVSRRNLPPGQYKITRSRMNYNRPDGQRSVGDMNPWRDWDDLQTYVGGFIGEVLAADGPQILHNIDLSADPVLGHALGDMHSCCAFPNYDGGQSLNWGIFFKAEPDFYSLDYLAEAMMDGNLLGMATRNLINKKRVSDLNDRLTTRLREIADIQRSLLPRTLPDIPGLTIRASYETSEEAGGDYYDFFQLPAGHWGILIADVAGHGPGAATVMAMLRAILHCYDHCDEHGVTLPARVLQFANDKLLSANLAGSFATAFFGVYDPRSAVLRYARAGHNPPRLRRASGQVLALDEAHALPLGVADQLNATEARVHIEPGDLLLLYTDGITEAFAPAPVRHAREMFGTHRLDAALNASAGAPDKAIDLIRRRLFEFTGRRDIDDDQTILAIMRRGEMA